MAFVNLLCYLIRPYPSKTHRSDDLFINAAIMQLATYEIDITISVPARLRKGQGAKEIGHNLAREQPKFGHNLVRKRHKIFYA